MENASTKESVAHFEETGLVDYYRDCGFQSGFQYTWPTMQDLLTEEQLTAYAKTLRVPEEVVIDLQLKRIRTRIEHNPDFYIFTNSVMRDSEPWYAIFNINPKGPLMQWRLTPEKWRFLLEESKKLIDQLPDGSIGKQIFILDTWNEWSEGHYIAPHMENGFAYLQAVREVFTKRDNLPDYRTPEMLGMGPYDAEWLKIIHDGEEK